MTSFHVVSYEPSRWLEGGWFDEQNNFTEKDT